VRNGHIVDSALWGGKNNRRWKWFICKCGQAACISFDGLGQVMLAGYIRLLPYVDNCC